MNPCQMADQEVRKPVLKVMAPWGEAHSRSQELIEHAFHQRLVTRRPVARSFELSPQP